ncbi:type II secretion system protein N [Gilvimarinus sp. SDUM040013]|uniref:Type II secretion system protein N n=1 Tax=Gilvimarinus gilvus TaxID=3058038 RepID=A0ABU4RZP0_9GAMM|nr:type II secretion system protein N [Gilvimarinus sp. SDUM040013]MDO3388731.1 type II secretion system protein N [Gilvimarinus sp. SDUM040013]MDX6849626.1 type II secretion system protein N [Gilvimarinus sp. SDUM040013]
MIRWIALGLLFWLAFVVTQIPATWGGYLMTNGTPLALSGISGTLWRGKANMASIQIDGRHYTLGSLDWTLKPLSILTLKPCAVVSTDFERQQISGTACAGIGGSITLTNANISVPAGLIQGLPEPSEITGQLSSHIETLKLSDNKLKALKGNLSWTKARLNNGQMWLNLGAFAADLSATAEGHIRADIFSLEGPIDLAGNVVMPLTGGIRIDTNFTFTETFARDVQADQWLPMVAEPLDDGRQRIKMTL